MLNFIDRWYDKIKPFLFKYKDGFFVLPYLGNSPLLIIESFRKMPFIKHDDNKQMIISNSPFVDANVYYQILKEDFILMYSKLKIKANICFKGITKKDVAHDFYCLTMITNLDNHIVSKRIIKGERIENSSFQLIKPGVSLDTYHFKDSDFQTFSIYFKESWLNNFIKEGKDKHNTMLDFKNSTSECYITSIDMDEYLTSSIENLNDNFAMDLTDRNRDLMLKQANEFIDYYLQKAFSTAYSAYNFHLSNADRIGLQEAVNILHAHLESKFPGITHISKQIGFSETKLKTLFKLCYQKTMLEYYQEIQMKEAFDMLMQGKHKVTEVANHFGYINVSKFSAMFKVYNNSLPSKVNSSEIKN